MVCTLISPVEAFEAVHRQSAKDVEIRHPYSPIVDRDYTLDEMRIDALISVCFDPSRELIPCEGDV